MPAAGVFVAFFNEAEPERSTLPLVGPVAGLVVAPRRLLGERTEVRHDLSGEFAGEGMKWLAAELELTQALVGATPRRDSFRVRAPDSDAYVRFIDLDGEPRPTDELGPFAEVIITAGRVVADGDVLAQRETVAAPWLLGVSCGEDAGSHRASVAFRTTSSSYHPQARGAAAAPDTWTSPAQAVAERVVAELKPEEMWWRPENVLPRFSAIGPPPPVAPPSEVAPAPEPAPVQLLSPEAEEQIYRMHSAPTAPTAPQPVAAAQVAALPPEDGFSVYLPRAAAPQPAPAPVQRRRDEAEEGIDWSAWLRYGVMALAVLAVATVGGGVLLSQGVSRGPVTAAKAANVGEPIETSDWTYVVTGVERPGSIGTTRPSGTYVVVRMNIINRREAIGELSPGNFGLVDGQGRAYSPQPSASAVYVRPGNPTPYAWPLRYPPKTPVRAPLVFDVDPSATDLRLTITGLSGTTIRLPN